MSSTDPYLTADPEDLQGGSVSLQGSTPTIQGSNPNLQPATQPVPVASGAPASFVGPIQPVGPTQPTSAPAPAPTPVVQPIQLNSLFSPYIGTRASSVNPSVLEYYNKQTGVGFSNEQQALSYASTLGFGNITNLSQLAAPVNTSPAQGTSNVPSGANSAPVQTPPSAGQTLASNAGTANLSPQDLISLIQASTQLTPSQLATIQSALGIPAAAAAAYAQPTQTTVDFYNAAYQNAGIPQINTQIQSLNDQINQYQQDLTDALSNVNENPFLDENTRVGRGQAITETANEEIGNLVNEQSQYQQLYQNAITNVNNLVTAHTQDFATQTAQNQGMLAYLENQAQLQATAQVAANEQQVYQYLPDYLQAKTTATPPETVTSPTTGQTFSYNPTTGSFEEVSSGTGGFTTNPLTGQEYSTVTGQPAGSSPSIGAASPSTAVGAGFPAGAQTPGTAAAVNNVSGMKANGQFIQYATPQDSFNATVSDIQDKISGQTSTGLNGNSTLSQFVNTWINGPGKANAVQPGQGYDATNVAQFLQQMGMGGVNPNTPISQIGATNLATAVAHFETGYSPGTSTASSGSGNTSSSSSLPANVAALASNPLVSVRQTSAGQYYVDLTNVPQAQEAYVQGLANSAGVPALTSDDVSQLNDIQTIQSQMAAVTQAITQFLPNTTNPASRALSAIWNEGSSVLQTNPAIASYQDFETSAVKTLEGLIGGSGSGVRLNSNIIQIAIDNFPTITDNLPTAQSKLATIQTQLTTLTNQIFQANTPVGASSQSSNSSSSTSSSTDPLGILP